MWSERFFEDLLRSGYCQTMTFFRGACSRLLQLARASWWPLSPRSLRRKLKEGLKKLKEVEKKAEGSGRKRSAEGNWNVLWNPPLSDSQRQCQKVSRGRRRRSMQRRSSRGRGGAAGAASSARSARLYPRIQESISILFFDFLIVFDDTLIKNMHIYFLDTLFLTTETVSWERK